VSIFIPIRASLSRWILLNDFEHLLLDEFFFEDHSIFVPNEVRLLGVDVIFLHATFKESDDVTIIWVLGETETSAVVHKLLELFGLVLAELLDLYLLLLFLDIGVLFSL